jgi:hypothetical protein
MIVRAVAYLTKNPSSMAGGFSNFEGTSCYYRCWRIETVVLFGKCARKCANETALQCCLGVAATPTRSHCLGPRSNQSLERIIAAVGIGYSNVQWWVGA